MNSKIISVLICIFILTSSSASIAQNATQSNPGPIQVKSGVLAESPWPMFQQNLNRTGLSPYDTSANNGELRWSYTIGTPVGSSPAIGADGTIYVGSQFDKFYAINPDGTLKWSFQTDKGTSLSPAIGSDGTNYICSEGGPNDSHLYAINPDGSEKWHFTIGNLPTSPTIGSDGTIYVGSVYSRPIPEEYRLYAIYPNGVLKWLFTCGGRIDEFPAIASDGTIYVCSRDHNLYALYPNGTLKWSFATDGEIWGSSPAIGSDGTIYLSHHGDKKLYAVNPDGTEKWNFTTNGYVVSSPAIGSDGTIYFGSNDGKLYALGTSSPLVGIIDIDPDTLNLKSKGVWITAYITLNEPSYDVNDIDISTVMLEDTIPAEWGDIQNDTLMVKFDRSEVEDMLSPGRYNLKVAGELTDGTAFNGYSDEIRVIEPP